MRAPPWITVCPPQPLTETPSCEAGYRCRPQSNSSTKPLATHGRTIHVGQTRSFCDVRVMSVFPDSGLNVHAAARQFGPVTEVGVSFDHLVGAKQERSGMVSPSAFPVLRLITSSNLVGSSNGNPAGLAGGLLRVLVLPSLREVKPVAHLPRSAPADSRKTPLRKIDPR